MKSRFCTRDDAKCLLLFNFISISGTGSDVQAPKRQLKRKLKKPADGASKGDLHFREHNSPKYDKPSHSSSTCQLVNSSSKTIEPVRETTGNLETFNQNGSAKDGTQATNNRDSLIKDEEKSLKTAEGSVFQALPGNAWTSENVECSLFGEMREAPTVSTESRHGLVCETESSQGKQNDNFEDEHLGGNPHKRTSKTKHSMDMLTLEGHKSNPKKPKHRKGARFEGERIPYLVKQKQYRKDNQEEEEEQKKNDDYVLERLFKKSGNLFIHLRNSARLGKSIEKSTQVGFHYCNC